MVTKFQKNLTKIEIQNPVRENREILKRRQGLGRTAGGTVYVYDLGISTQNLVLSFSNLRQSEKDCLQAFYNTVVNGVMETFSYTDHLGNVWTARFLNTELEFTEADSIGSTQDTYESGGAVYPTTTWEEGIYNVEIELEVST